MEEPVEYSSVHHRKGGAEEIFRNKIAVGNCVEGVLRNAVKMEQFAGNFTVDGIRRPRERGAAERHHVHAGAASGKTVQIAKEHFRICVEVLRAVDRLRLAEMGKSGHHVFYVGACKGAKGIDKGGEERLHLV